MNYLDFVKWTCVPCYISIVVIFAGCVGAQSQSEDSRPIDVGAINDLNHWIAFHGNNLRKSVVNEGSEQFEIIAADISRVPGQWSGIEFTSPQPTDWTNVQSFSLLIRWGSLDKFNPSVILADSSDNRWAWRYEEGDVVSPVENGWELWNMARESAERQDQNFDWTKVQKIMVSSFTDADSQIGGSSVELMTVQESNFVRVGTQ